MQLITTIFPGAATREHATGCGECQTSCQSACKTSCTVANQNCEQIDAIYASNLRKSTSRVRNPQK